MIPEILVLTILAFVSAFALLAIGRSGPGPMGGFWFFFLLLLAMGWAISAWIMPDSPNNEGPYWAAPIGAVVCFCLIALITVPGRAARRDEEKRRQLRETSTETEARHAVERGFTIFFWVALTGLALVSFAGYALAIEMN